MKKVAFFLISLSFIIGGLASCSDDDNDFPRTGENGRLSIAQYGTDMVYFSYKGNKIHKIQMNNAFESEFEYTNNELSGIRSYPIDERIADGNGKVSFKREGNKIIVESWGEPSSETFITEIELDENDVPLKITEVGSMGHIDGQVQKVRDGKYYTLVTIDPQTKNFLMAEKYIIETSEKVSTYAYEYADTPGIMSKIDLPLWYFAYINYWSAAVGDTYNLLYFNYSGNVVKKIVDDDLHPFHGTVEYKYEYNKAGYPVKLINLSINGGVNEMAIRY